MHPFAANSLLFRVHSCLLRSSKCISGWPGAGAFLDCALFVVPCAFSDLVVTLFVFGGSESTFRDRCRKSERFFAMRRFHGRLGALDMAAGFGVL